MRLSREELKRIYDWANSNNYDYVEWKKDDASKVLGYKVDTLPLRGEKKQE